MFTRLFKGRRKKISIQSEGTTRAAVMSERTSYLLLLAALVLGILVLIDAAWARGRPPPPPPPPAPDTPPARYWHGFAGEEDFTTDNGVVTPTLKLKGRVVQQQRYTAAIEPHYG